MDKSIGDEKTMGPVGTAQDAVLSAGSVFGQYQIIRLLGKGGMGEVYEAEHTTLGKLYALKLLPADFINSANALERFKREARVMANLEHPNIIRVDEFGETEGRYWLRMELVGGARVKLETGNSKLESCVTLADLAKAQGGKLSQDTLLPILGNILDGLEYAHAHGAMHRDLKPSNILLTSQKGTKTQSNSSERSAVNNWTAKIADFGLVKLVGEDWIHSMVELSVQRSMSIGEEKTIGGTTSASNGSSTKSLLGTYEYMSPEQKHGEEADARSDIYSVGLMIYKLLTGRELGMRTPGQIDPRLDKAWDDVVLNALEESPEERFQSVGELMAALPRIETTKNTKETEEENPQTVAKSTKEEPVERVPPPAAPAGATPSPAGADENPGPEEDRKWVAELGGGVSMDFMPIKAGSFQMGSNNGDLVEKPVHRVTLTKPFWLAKTEVTQAQYEKVMGSNPSIFKGSQNPVEEVSWNDAKVFCKKLCELEGVPEGTYTLPTEAQWEYACRAGTTGDYATSTSSGQAGNLDAMAWYSSNSGNKTHPVGTKQPNAWGLYDMHGNVWEWCLDVHDSGFYGKSSGADPVNTGSGSYRVLRGGGWNDFASYCRSANRYWFDPSITSCNFGFRVCLVRK